MIVQHYPHARASDVFEELLVLRKPRASLLARFGHWLSGLFQR